MARTSTKNKKSGLKVIRPIVRQCTEAGCLRMEQDKRGKAMLCMGWANPFYMWDRYGTCPHVLTDSDELQKMLDDMKEYEKLGWDIED